jgi:hypothetical protein
MTTAWAVGVGDGDGVAEGLGDTAATDVRACVPAWAAPQAVKPKARTQAINQLLGSRILARDSMSAAKVNQTGAH